MVLAVDFFNLPLARKLVAEALRKRDQLSDL
jgi:hypothetical protein